jgi:hypothetical protein
MLNRRRRRLPVRLRARFAAGQPERSVRNISRKPGSKTNALLRVILGRSASPKQISGLSVLKFPFSDVTRNT